MRESRTLLEIGDDLRALDELWLDSCDPATGEVSPAVDALLVQLREAVSREEADKLDWVVNLIRRKKAEIDAAKYEAERYAMQAKIRERFVDRLEAFLQAYITSSGRTKVQTATGRTVSVQANGRAPIRWLPDIDLEALPPEFVRVVKSIDAEAVRRGLAERNPDALRIATLGERGFHLRIR